VIYRSPYPYFGGKAKVAARIWERLGRPRNYVEPFFGSGAVLLGRPDPEWRGAIETVNDANGYIANFWRALQSDPDAVAYYADWPINENDLHARHWWLINRKESLRARLEGDSDYFDAKVAGWWVWGMAAWIGSGFCDGTGRWYVENGKLIHAGDAGRGVARQLIHAGNAGRGVARKLIHAGNAGQGGGLYDYLYGLAERTKRVRVACGDWSRVCGHSVTTAHGLTGFTSIRRIGSPGGTPNCTANTSLPACLMKLWRGRYRTAQTRCCGSRSAATVTPTLWTRSRRPVGQQCAGRRRKALAGSGRTATMRTGTAR
jgi:DNA adenine methylase